MGPTWPAGPVTVDAAPVLPVAPRSPVAPVGPGVVDAGPVLPTPAGPVGPACPVCNCRPLPHDPLVFGP
ncbi:MAG: hypothetical protein EBR82_56675 [Caulobacteraceae bacterium]|nr:hypothetical protein [Caulobacteraceae bacterium]